MFRGRSKHTLDSKGRLAIPVRFKETLEQRSEDCLVITSHDSCLWGYARDDWIELEKKVAGLSQFDNSGIIFLRYFISGAEECTIKNGRITIPQSLREVAGLEKEIVLVGLLTRFEIWDRAKWEAEFVQLRDNFRDASQDLSNLTIGPAGSHDTYTRPNS